MCPEKAPPSLFLIRHHSHVLHHSKQTLFGYPRSVPSMHHLPIELGVMVLPQIKIISLSLIDNDQSQLRAHFSPEQSPEGCYRGPSDTPREEEMRSAHAIRQRYSCAPFS